MPVSFSLFGSFTIALLLGFAIVNSIKNKIDERATHKS